MPWLLLSYCVGWFALSRAGPRSRKWIPSFRSGPWFKILCTGSPMWSSLTRKSRNWFSTWYWVVTMSCKWSRISWRIIWARWLNCKCSTLARKARIRFWEHTRQTRTFSRSSTCVTVSLDTYSFRLGGKIYWIWPSKCLRQSAHAEKADSKESKEDSSLIETPRLEVDNRKDGVKHCKVERLSHHNSRWHHNKMVRD